MLVLIQVQWQETATVSALRPPAEFRCSAFCSLQAFKRLEKACPD